MEFFTLPCQLFYFFLYIYLKNFIKNEQWLDIMILSFYFLILLALEINYKHSSIYFFRHFYACEGANYLFPEDWASYEAAIPVEERGDYLLAYGRRLRGELGAEGSIFVSESVSGNPFRAPMVPICIFSFYSIFFSHIVFLFLRISSSVSFHECSRR